MSELSYKEVSELAEQAGVSDGLFIVKNVSSDAIHLFAELVAKRAADIEREACAVTVETCRFPRWAEYCDSREVYADAIRARNITKENTDA